MLAPLDDLGPERAAVALETLTSYLDHQSSPKHAAAAVHLHQNAVKDRISRIVTLLDIDLTDPDVWFGPRLACRMRGPDLPRPAMHA